MLKTTALAFALLALALGFAIGGSLVASFQAPVQSTQTSGRQPPSDDTDRERARREGFWGKSFSDPAAFFTLVIAVFTIVLAGATVGLYVVTGRAAFAAASAAKMAEKQVQAARTDIKAWIHAGPHLQSLGPTNPYATGRTFKMHVINYGRTLGLVTKLHVQCEAVPPVGDPETFAYAEEGTVDLEIPLGQSDKVWIIEEHEFYMPDRSPYVFGYVEYLDVFGRTFVSRFCGSIIFSPRILYQPSGSPAWNQLGKKKPDNLSQRQRIPGPD